MDIYKTKINEYEEKVNLIASRLKKLSIFRLFVFLGSLALIIFIANERALIPLLAVTLVCSAIFILIVKQYNKLRFLERQTRFLNKINREELLRLENDFTSFPKGNQYIESGHAFTADLDIFGNNSLYQLINRTTTESGSIQLAKWLSHSVTIDEIKSRREAAQELTPNLAWRQDFQASGMHHTTKGSDYFALKKWVEKTPDLLPGKYKYYALSMLLSLVSCFAVYFYFNSFFTLGYDAKTTLLASAFLITMLVINAWFLKSIKKVATEIVDSTHQNITILKAYEALIIKIEEEGFTSPKLEALQKVFTQNGHVASQAIKQLRRILSLSQLKATKRSPFGNQFYPILNILFILDVYWIIASEKWKEKYAEFVPHWIDAISEFEVLNSLAGFHYSNPNYTYVTLKETPYTIDFKALGHPLVSKKQRVCNDFTFEGKGQITLITGSNMAGKSTFLRTVGINLVLAYIGAPCAAEGGTVSQMEIFTSMRTQDNLAEGISSFYAELKRIELLLQLLKTDKPVFFMLDEMFKGTNSKDRSKGGVSLIKQLSKLDAFGIISTHDLELTKIAGKHMPLTNYSFNSSIESGKLLFDYKLTKGICTDFNASELMKRSGIEIIADFEN